MHDATQAGEDTAGELQRLRGTMRDVVALSTLPAVWIGYGLDRIAQSLADVLARTLDLDLIYVRLRGADDQDLIEAVRDIRRESAGEGRDAIRSMLSPLIDATAYDRPPSIPDSAGTGDLNTVVVRFGHSGDFGALVACSKRESFPSDSDRLLLGIGANQTAIVIQRKRAEQALRKEREWFRVTLESIGDAVIATDTRGKITFLNAAAERLTGWSQEDAQAQPLDEVFGVIDEQTRERAESPVAKVLRDGAVVETSDRTVLLARGGAERPIEESAAPILGASGETVGVVLTFRDVTGQRQAERALQDARSRLDAALQAGAIVTWTWDIVNNLLFAEEPLARLFNVDVSGSEAASLDKYIKAIHPEDLAKVSAGLAAAADEGEDYEVDYRIMQPNGSIRWVVARGRPERDQSGRPVRMPGVLIDITDRKNLEEQLRIRVEQLAHADRRKDEFLAILAHELRNPLAPIRTGLELMRVAGDDSELRDEIRTTMEEQTRQLVRLVDDLLDVSRITTGKVTLRMERVEIASVVRTAVEATRSLVEELRHDLSVTLPSQPISILGDAARLTQILSNLLTNAARYTPTGGRIRLTVERELSDAVISVRDNGIGIPKEMLDNVFEMFTQVDRSLERSQSGLGIGLTLVKTLVTMHKGTVIAHSEGQGSGSEFVVRIPIHAEPDPEPQATPAEPTQQSPLRVLVVDDNKDAAKLLSLVVKRLGNTVRVAHDGLEALEAAEAFRPHVVLMDIGMPNLNGYEAARRMRERPRTRDTVLIALTGWGQEEDRQRTQQAGFDHHLVKPVEPAALRKLLAEVVPASA